MAKYDGIDPLAKLHPGEPFFFVRAQDRLATSALIAYYEHMEKVASERLNENLKDEIGQSLINQTQDILRLLGDFSQWQIDHLDLIKFPD